MKLLFKLTENYFVALRNDKAYGEALFISCGNGTVYNIYNVIMVIHLPYSVILELLDKNDVSAEHYIYNYLFLNENKDPTVYYHFVNELVKELRFDINNFTFDLLNFILKFIKNQIFI